MSEPYLSVVIPAYNESRTIVGTMTAIKSWLETQAIPFELIVVADGTDGTRERAAAFAGRDSRFMVLGSSRRAGKGRGVRDGILRSTGRFVGFLDADYKTPIDEMAKFLPWLEKGCDLVIGSRQAGGASIEQAQPFYRQIGSRVFGYGVREFMDLQGISDTQCGFKFFNQRAAMTLFTLQKVDGYMFDVEILRLARKLDYSIQEVGVRWKDDNDTRYNPILGTWKNARELLRIRMLQYPELAKTAPAAPAAEESVSPVSGTAGPSRQAA